MEAMTEETRDSFPGVELVVNGVLYLTELESTFPDLYGASPPPDLHVVLALCKIPEVAELLKYGLRQLGCESSRARLRHNFSCFMIDHSDRPHDEFVTKASVFFSEFLSPWGPLESLAFASNLGAGGGISGGLRGRRLDEDCRKLLEVLQSSFTPGGPPRCSSVVEGEDHSGGYRILGAFGSSDRCGLTSATSKYSQAIKDVNAWLRAWLPGHTWTSLCINQNAKISLHADQGNQPGTLNYSISLGDFAKGALWIEDPSGDERREFEGEVGQLRGRCVDTHGQLFSFDAGSRRYVEEWIGTRWSVMAYTCRHLEDFSKAEVKELLDLGFPLPEFTQSRWLETYRHLHC